MFGPAEWGGVEDGVFYVEAGAVFDQEPDDCFVPCEGGLVERGGVGVGSGRVEAIGIDAGAEEEMGSCGVAELGREGEGAVEGGIVGGGEELGGLGGEAEAGGGGDIFDFDASADERFGGWLKAE